MIRSWWVPAGLESGVERRTLPVARGAAAALEVLEPDGEWAAELVRTLRGAREELAGRPTREVVRAIAAAGARLADPSDALRARALDEMPVTSGLSPKMCEAVLDGMAADWLEGPLLTLLDEDLGGPDVLDGFVARSAGTEVMAVGDAFAYHLTAGTVPGVSVTSLIRSLLVGTPLLLDPGRGDVTLPVYFLEALAEEAPDVASAAAVVYSREGESTLSRTAAESAKTVVVYGSDATVRSVRDRLGPTVRLVAYHHRLSFAVLGRDALTGSRVAATADAVARAVAMFDQRGCVSPHFVFVEEGGEVAPGDVAAAVADALGALAVTLPSGRRDERESSALHQVRGAAEAEAAVDPGYTVRSGGTEPWTVLFEPGGAAEPSCLNRVVRILPVDDVSRVPDRVRPLSRHLQSVGTAGVGKGRFDALAEALARVGATRIVPLDEMAFPPAWWRHDGRGPLDVLVRWVERR